MIGDRSKFALFWDVLSDQAVHVFVGAPFPGSERMRKEEVSFQFMGDTFVFSEILAIVSGDGMRMFRKRLE